MLKFLLLLLHMSFTGYVTRFLFALCSYEEWDKSSNCDSHAVQHLERLCTGVNCEFCSHHLCSIAHEQSTENGSDSCGSDSGNKHSLQLVYDEDGDLIVERQFHQQFEIMYIG